MKGIPLRLTLILFLINHVKMRNVYLNIQSLEGITHKISIMFANLEPPKTIFEWISHLHNVSNAMENIANQMELYQIPSVDSDYLGETRLSINVMSFFFIKYLFRTFPVSLYKSILDEWKSQLKEMSLRFDSIQHDQQWSSSNQCNTEIPQPSQYNLFRTVVSFVSAKLQEFIVDCAISHYQYINGIISHERMEVSIEKELKNVREVLKKHHLEMRQRVAESERSIVNCDVKNPIRDEHYVELEKTFQLIIIPQIGLRRAVSNRTSCESISENRVNTESKKMCYENYCPSCEGTIKNCMIQLIIDYCGSSEGESRRYEWIETYKGGEIRIKAMNYGEAIDCPNRKPVTIRSHRFRSAYCICTCSENTNYASNSTFIISSKLMKSDVEKNKVITGVRFMKKQRVIYTQIKQGRLMPGGHILQNRTDKWKSLPFVTPEEVNTQLKTAESHEKFIVINDDIKHINFDDLECPPGDYVLTGVGLRLSRIKSNNSRIVLSIICHRADLKQGVVFPMRHTDLIEDLKPHQKKMEIGGLPPDKVHQEHLPDSSNDQFVEIKMSDKWKDAGQSVLPWFDTRDVTGAKSVPLSGIGIYHRGAYESGGYLAYRLLSIDYSVFILPEDPYFENRKFFESAPRTLYCSDVIPRVLCILCNGSYAGPDEGIISYNPDGSRRGIVDECCKSPQLCDANDLKKYCGPFVEDLTGLSCPL